MIELLDRLLPRGPADIAAQDCEVGCANACKAACPLTLRPDQNRLPVIDPVSVVKNMRCDGRRGAQQTSKSYDSSGEQAHSQPLIRAILISGGQRGSCLKWSGPRCLSPIPLSSARAANRLERQEFHPSLIQIKSYLQRVCCVSLHSRMRAMLLRLRPNCRWEMGKRHELLC